jgi:hypothetical protein
MSAASGGDPASYPPLWQSAGGSADPQVCSWYVWVPAPTTVDCEYLLPSDNPDNDPNFDPKTWNPHYVRVEFRAKNIGEYAGTVDGCGRTDGWYYVDADGQAPTRFMLCPQSCARVPNDGAFLRLAAETCH